MGHLMSLFFAGKWWVICSGKITALIREMFVPSIRTGRKWWGSWPNLFFHLLCCNNVKNKQCLPSNETAKNKSHSSFLCAGCVKMYLALIEAVSLMRLPLCYWATRRLLVIQVNHYCFIIENRNSSLCKSAKYTQACVGSERGSTLFFSREGRSVNTQWWPVGFFHLCLCPSFGAGRSLQRGRDRWVRYR